MPSAVESDAVSSATRAYALNAVPSAVHPRAASPSRSDALGVYRCSPVYWLYRRYTSKLPVESSDMAVPSPVHPAETRLSYSVLSVVNRCMPVYWLYRR